MATQFSGQVVCEQLRNGGRIPGYAGYMPTSYATGQYSRTYAAGNDMLAQTLKAPVNVHLEDHRKVLRRNCSDPILTGTQWYNPPQDSKYHILRNHRIANYPGYQGYMPSKYAENILGNAPIKIGHAARDQIGERERWQSDRVLQLHNETDRLIPENLPPAGKMKPPPAGVGIWTWAHYSHPPNLEVPIPEKGLSTKEIQKLERSRMMDPLKGLKQFKKVTYRGPGLMGPGLLK